ncbi:SAF domain-containing protein [Mycobacterium sp. CVI_P3]|uniref:SAF domain-containing protein n=1 Tax=Mycobacterium pinniadriaticum TaxID=2994102 RepID=A0ABT3SDI6_9MYCO|nr:SAF domain-containing protein [Mycobacterium pinniadriaticum]MCX2931200.1 SAF domain-containing protein [Mycobacterium pinniadriaticum]MCX2937576.1 SAF domain-containing protein [Mycobacterium pinniadriaticum]
MGESLNPTLPARIRQMLRPDFTRTTTARRVAAGGLVVLAGVAALRPDPGERRTDVVVAAHDLSPGQALAATDLRLEKRSAPSVPDGASATIDTLVGSTLAGPARRGEVLTDVRVLGPRLAGLAAGPDARVVPLTLADAAVLDLIRPGDVVDVMGVAGAGTDAEPTVVASDAIVVLVSPKQKAVGTGDDRVVLVALPAAAAHSLAAAALVKTVTLTIH